MRTREPLTVIQQAVLGFIRHRIETKGYGPTVREISANFGHTSPNAAFGHLKALERKGYVKREEYLPRAIALPGTKRRPSYKLPYGGHIS